MAFFTNGLTLRGIKKSALTHAELDNNFLILDSGLANLQNQINLLTGGTGDNGRNVYYIPSGENFDIPYGKQALVIGDLLVDGSITNAGQLIFVNGSIILSGGTYIDDGGDLINYELEDGSGNSLLNIASLQGVNLTGINTGDIIVWDGVNFIPQPFSGGTGGDKLPNYFLPNNEERVIDENYQHFVYGDLTVRGTYVNDGKITVLNGILDISSGGTIDNSGGGILEVTDIESDAVIVLGDGVGSSERCGNNNNACGNYSTVFGRCNTASNGYCYSTIGGGYCNLACGNNTTIGGGSNNQVSGNGSTISGGECNFLSSNHSTIGGGCCNSNQVTAEGGVIGGGYCNCIDQINSTVGGGFHNHACASYSTIDGGFCNTTLGEYNTIGGGVCNITNGCHSTVSGGYCNTASCNGSTIGGGCNNSASSYHSTVGGGCNNSACGCNSTIGGGFCNNSASGYFSTIGGGGCNDISYSTTSATIGGGFCNKISWGTFSATIAGGQNNTVSGPYAPTIGGGSCNTASGSEHPTIGGGRCNTASGRFSTVSGGYCNSASGYYSTIDGGRGNSASGSTSTIGGGCNNTTFGGYSTVGGGKSNTASGYDKDGNSFSVVAGGAYNQASCPQSTVSGGWYNSASNYGSTVGGGECNQSCGQHSTIGGGFCNRSFFDCSTIGGGRCNLACGLYSTIGGGCFNTACENTTTIAGGECNITCSPGSTIGGGFINCATCLYSTIAGGRNNTVSGYNSIIGGGCNNIASGDYTGILGGRNNNTCNYNDTIIIGSNICATKSGTTFVNNLNIVDEPTTDTGTLNALVWDPTTKEIKQRAISGGTSTGSANLTQDLTVQLGTGVSFGGVSTGQVFSASTKTVEDVLRSLLIKSIPPTYTQPSVAMTNPTSQSYEIGTFLSSVSVSSLFTQNDAGPIDTHRLFKTVGANPEVQILSNNSNSISTTDTNFYLTATTQYRSNATYSGGTVKNDNLGNPYPSGKILSGTTTSSYRILTPVRKLFYGGTNTTPTTSSLVRSLPNSQLNPQNGTSFSITSVAGTNKISFAYPSTLRDAISIIYVTGGNVDNSGNFIPYTTVSVDGDNNLLPTNYKVYTYTSLIPFTGLEVYTITI